MAEGVRYREALVQKLERSLRLSFNQPYLKLTRKPGRSGGGFRISLEAGDRTALTDDGTEQTVLAIHSSPGEPSPFYFSFVVVFEIETRGDYILQHSSLSVFQDIYAGELAPLFRAEWDRKAAADSTSKHAQPHWHFVQSPERIEGIVRTVIGPPTEFSPGPGTDLFSKIADCGKFHFAMTAQWDKTTAASHKQVFESNEFPKWFDSLTRYVAEQIAYLVAKAPPAVPAEFAPADGTTEIGPETPI